MLKYYLNQKTGELIIVDSETNEISVAQKLELKTGEIPKVEPLKEERKKAIKQSIFKRRHSRKGIPEDTIQKIRKLHSEGMKRNLIAAETGVKLSTIYKYTSEAKKNKVKGVKEKKLTGKKPISPEIIQKIKEMVNQGMFPKQIAKELGIGYTTVYKYGPKVKKITEEMRAKMRELRKGGMTFGDIGKEVGVSKSQATFYSRDVKIESQEEEKPIQKEPKPIQI